MSKRAPFFLGIVVVLGLVVGVRVLAGKGHRAKPAPAAEEDAEPAVAAAPPPAQRPAWARPAQPAPPRPAPAPAPRPSAAAPLDEPSLMARIRDLGGSNPALSLQLAREGNARFPDSPDAAERAWTVAKSLSDLGRFDEAVEEARAMVAKYPDNSFAADVQRHLLSNPMKFDSGSQQ